jgi:hypothetical protein
MVTASCCTIAAAKPANALTSAFNDSLADTEAIIAMKTIVRSMAGIISD